MNPVEQAACDVLIVEDDPDVRTDLVFFLGDCGLDVVAASDGFEALGRLHRGLAPRLILLDLMMPRMNGWELREELLASPTLREIPVIVMSAARDFIVNRALLQAVDFVEKPFDVDQLVARVQARCPTHPART